MFVKQWHAQFLRCSDPRPWRQVRVLFLARSAGLRLPRICWSEIVPARRLLSGFNGMRARQLDS